MELYVTKLIQADENNEYKIIQRIRELERKFESKSMIQQYSPNYNNSKENLKSNIGEAKLIVEEIQDASHINKFRNAWPEVLDKIKEKKPFLYGWEATEPLCQYFQLQHHRLNCGRWIF